jgi:hypothetical protein
MAVADRIADSPGAVLNEVCHTMESSTNHLMLISWVFQLAGYAMMLKNPTRAGSSIPRLADNGNRWGCIVETGYL